MLARRCLVGTTLNLFIVFSQFAVVEEKKGKKNDAKGQTDPKADSQRFGTGTI